MTTKLGRPANHMRLAKYAHGEVSQDHIDIAIKRITPHLLNQQMVDFDLRQLLVNVYIQGWYDMAEAVVNKELKAEL